MKRIIVLWVFLLSMQTSFSLEITIDSMLQKIADEKDESSRVGLIVDFFATTQDSDPMLDMQKAKKLLQQSHDNDDRIGEALSLSEIGYDYRSLGNTINGLDYNIKAMAIAEETGNDELIAAIKIYVALYYKDLADYPKALQLLLSADDAASTAKSYKIQSWALMNLGEIYNAMNKKDSALMYSQRAYELCVRINYSDLLGFISLELGKVHAKMGNVKLANSYYDMAIEDAIKNMSPKYLNQAYYAVAQSYYNANKIDSVVMYAKKAITAVKNTAFSNMSIKPAKLLAQIYESRNSDSTVKYLKMFMAANDSLFSAKTIQQGQILTFENELRQQEMAEEKSNAEEHRRQNIQYALLALGIVCFIIIFLLLSLGFITNEKAVGFFDVIALLLVFEFLNLLLHPFLERITNHTPVLMLPGLVCIAALLVPLHHKIEKWATHQLIEKNKQIRLAAAKKTIDKLENQTKT